ATSGSPLCRATSAAIAAGLSGTGFAPPAGSANEADLTNVDSAREAEPDTDSRTPAARSAAELPAEVGGSSESGAASNCSPAYSCPGPIGTCAANSRAPDHGRLRTDHAHIRAQRSENPR